MASWQSLIPVRIMLCFLLLLLGSLILIPGTSSAQRIAWSQRTVTDRVHIPWEMRWGPDNWIWFTERDGHIAKIHPETGEVRRFHKLPRIAEYNEAGALGLVLHPSFADNPFVYIAYNFYTHDSLILFRVERYRYTNEQLVEPLVIIDSLQSFESHIGSRLVIHDDKLWITTGERWVDTLAQNDASIQGKILRVNLDGTIPEDNPWPGSPVWSKGHRNPQGLAFGPTGILYSSEHGFWADDELNIIERGGNYGWPFVWGFPNWPEEVQVSIDSAVKVPIYDWTPTVAVSGISYYNSDRIPEWKNSLLVATLKDESIWQMKLDSSGREVVEVNRYPVTYPDQDLQRIRDFCISPDGRVFVSTSRSWGPGIRDDRIFEVNRIGIEPYHASLCLPQDHAKVDKPEITFSWESISKLAKYHVQIARDSAFTDLIVDEVTSDTTLLLLSETDKDLYWRVKEARTDGPWTPYRVLHVQLAPVVTTVVTPANGSLTYSSQTLLQWHSVEDVTSYEVEIARDTLFSPPNVLRIVEDTSFLLEDLQSGHVYYWRIRPQHARGQWTPTHAVMFIDTIRPATYSDFVKVSTPLFAQSVDIRVSLSRGTHLDLTIVDAAGRRVATLASKPLDAGEYSFRWTPQGLAQGTYWYVVTAGSARYVGRLIYQRFE